MFPNHVLRYFFRNHFLCSPKLLYSPNGFSNIFVTDDDVRNIETCFDILKCCNFLEDNDFLFSASFFFLSAVQNRGAYYTRARIIHR